MKMGSGRNGILNQSMKKIAPRRPHNIAKFLVIPGKREEKKTFIPEQAFECMKNMDPQQLADFLLPNDDDWLVKTSAGNASGS